ncbi:MAG: dihydroneopterin aldolase [Marinilabiliales bacterium]
MDYIEIEGMEFYAYHGHYDEERQIGNKFILNIKIETDLQKAAKSDNLDDALNYVDVYEIIKEEMHSVKSNLLENICERILNKLYNNLSLIKSVELKISKINPPIGGRVEKVSITMRR